jgi:DNA recombination protein RmuC
MRAAAGQIQAEVGKLIDDVMRLHERVLKLQAHFNQANEDVRQIVISAEKAEKRGGRIAEVEFAEDAADALPVPPVRQLQAGE